MKKLETKQLIIILIPLTILTLVNILLIGYLLYKLDIQTTNKNTSTHKQVQEHKAVAETHNSEHNFGQVTREEGVVSTQFEIENHGKEILEIEKISTSCGCTSAEIDIEEIGFNETAILTVKFDPNFHEEPEGVFERFIYVETNDPENPELEFQISIEII